MKKRFRVLARRFCRKEDFLLQEDVRSGIALARQPDVRKLYKREPALEALVVSLKYDPWRQAAVRVAKRCGLHTFRSNRRSLVQRARLIRRVGCGILSEMERYMKVEPSKREAEAKAWVANVGRFVSHVMGPIMQLRRLGVATTAQSDSRKGAASKCAHGKILRLGSWSAVQIATSTGRVAQRQSLQKIEKFIRRADILSTITPVTTLTEWRSEFQRVVASLVTVLCALAT